MNLPLFVLAAYLAGSIPFSHLFPRLKGKEVSREGTKNIGATNALVVAGPLFGALALVGDLAKGFFPAFLAGHYLADPWAVVLCGLAAVIGHDFSLFLRFKGGKGVATTGGVLLAIDPFFALTVVLFWVLLIVVSRYFIPSTLIIAGAIPLMMLILGFRFEQIVFGLGAFGLILFTHRADLRRILAGQELTTSEAVAKYLKKS